MSSGRFLICSSVVLIVILLLVLFILQTDGRSSGSCCGGSTNTSQHQKLVHAMSRSSDEPRRAPQPIEKRSSAHPPPVTTQEQFTTVAATSVGEKHQTESEIIEEEILEAAPEYIPPLRSSSSYDIVDQDISVVQGEAWGESPKYIPRNDFYPAIPVGGQLDALQAVEQSNILNRYQSPKQSLDVMERF